MNLERIKNLIKKNGDKFVLVENDVPEIVMMSFQEYEKLTEGYSERSEGSHPFQKRTPVAESLESDLPEETEFVIPMGPASPSLGGPSVESRRAKPMRLEDISLDDLPL